MTPKEKEAFVKTLTEAIEKTVRVSETREDEAIHSLMGCPAYKHFVLASARANVEGLGYDGSKQYETDDVFVMPYPKLLAALSAIFHAGIRIGMTAQEMGMKLP
jgi:hypothetical protein